MEKKWGMKDHCDPNGDQLKENALYRAWLRRWVWRLKDRQVSLWAVSVQSRSVFSCIANVFQKTWCVMRSALAISVEITLILKKRGKRQGKQWLKRTQLPSWISYNWLESSPNWLSKRGVIVRKQTVQRSIVNVSSQELSAPIFVTVIIAWMEGLILLSHENQLNRNALALVIAFSA